jgi:hydroxyacylglutathione hydrolase
MYLFYNPSKFHIFCIETGGKVMLVKQFDVGGDRNYAYLVADETSREAFIVDPANTPKTLIRYAKKKKLSIKHNFCTHGHSDHTNGNETIRSILGLTPLFYGIEDPGSGVKVTDGASFPLGILQVKILHTPGHTQESICLYIEDALFTGDTLFVGKVGGTDFDAGARQEFDVLHQKLLKLPDETRVFPGHNYGVAPQSTIGNERLTNPFLLQPDFASFIDLKRNWAEYKRRHGIV